RIRARATDARGAGSVGAPACSTLSDAGGEGNAGASGTGAGSMAGAAGAGARQPAGGHGDWGTREEEHPPDASVPRGRGGAQGIARIATERRATGKVGTDRRTACPRLSS